MKDLPAYLITFVSVIIALVVVWFYAKDTFQLVAIVLIIYLAWKTVQWIRHQRS